MYRYIADSPVQSPTQFSPSTHSFVDAGATEIHASASYANRAAEAFAHLSISVGERVATLFGIHGNGDKEAVSANPADNKSSATSRDRTPRASMTAEGGNVELDLTDVRTTDEADWGSKSDVNGSTEDVANLDTTTVVGTGSESGSNTERMERIETLGTISGESAKNSDAPVDGTISEG